MMYNVCEICGTKNEQGYTYCKNCGHALNVTATSAENNGSENFAYNTCEPMGNAGINFAVRDYDGVSAEEMTVFVGKKSHNILPKFAKMQITGSKFSWCWPAAILGYMFGPMGAALWFFYRKMYKAALIFASIGAVIVLLTSTLSAGSYSQFLNDVFDGVANGDYTQTIELLEIASQPKTTLSYVAELLDEISGIAAGIVAGVYGYYLYEKHCVRKIISYRSAQADQRYYKMGLAALGGVSGGMLALGIFIMIGISNVSSLVAIAISLAGK